MTARSSKKEGMRGREEQFLRKALGGKKGPVTLKGPFTYDVRTEGEGMGQKIPQFCAF